MTWACIGYELRMHRHLLPTLLGHQFGCEQDVSNHCQQVVPSQAYPMLTYLFTLSIFFVPSHVVFFFTV